MKRNVLLKLTALLLTSLAPLHAESSTPLAEAGRALQPIIVSTNATAATKAIAGELAEYLGRISGANFEVQCGDGSHGIVLGTLAEFPNRSLNRSLKIINTFDGKEAFVIRSERDRVLLIGATELGASHAAFRLLEHLGCRWFFPAKEWEVVTPISKLDVSLDVSERPRMLARRIWYGYGAFGDKGHPRRGSAQKDYDDWARHNLMASSFRVYAGHAWQGIIADNKTTFAEHPEYLALVKGKREGEQLCVSNPEVQRLAVHWAMKFFEKNPDREMVSMECSDGDGQCECENCTKLGSISDRVFTLANVVAREVAKKYPGKQVGCLAYNEHSEPPSFKLEPNVYVQLTAGFIRGRYNHDELLELWPKASANLGFYEYFSVWLWDFDKLPGGNGANITRTKTMIDRYLKAGATSFDAESGNNWGVHGRGYYVCNKLLWNPDADVHALLADFYDKAFGPATPAMKRYYERVAPDNSPLISRGLVGEAFRDVEEAALLAKDRPDVLQRIDQIKHYLRYVHLRWQLDHEKDKARQKELTVAVLTHAYRTRYEYMNHWAAMRQPFANDAAKKFSEPTWNVNDRSPKPWQVETPVTREETAQGFHEGLTYFQPTPVEEMKFVYDDLVPSKLDLPGVKPAALTQAFQRVEKYAIASTNGEPIELEIIVGIIAWYRDRRDAKWTLKNEKGRIVSQGEQKLDGEPHNLTLKVPRAGTYLFECNDASAGWRITVPAERPVVWLCNRGVRSLPLGQFPERFFYVPRGTKQLQFFYSGNACKVIGPDRKPMAEVNANDEVVTIPVPEGKDGTVWSLSPHTHSQLWFFNAPNVLAASPAALLLPRGLVKKDNIK
jgi:hypothetical protein